MKHTPLINTSSGPLYGLRLDDMNAFLGIPYAKAPINELRFSPPQPISWKEAKYCTRPGTLAPQMPSRLASVLGDQQNLEQSEDCLHLSIWAPTSNTQKEQKKPVVIWIHGGAWMTGGASLDWYDGEHLAKTGDMVVINVNYRLGPLGWLYVPEKTANAGLLDLAQAVEWIKENVHLFGGDPDNICLMGQSAGASCILGLLAMGIQIPRAIVQSASLGRGFWQASEAKTLTQELLHAAGVSSLEQAKELPTSHLLEAFKAPSVQAKLLQEGAGRSFYSPVLDGSVLPSDLNENFEKHTAATDVLIGYTLHEMTAFKKHDALEDSIEESYKIFGEKSLLWAQHAVAQGKEAWVYRFDHAPNNKFGACHCIELPYLFNNFEAFEKAPMLSGESKPHRKEVASAIQQAWIQFIHGKPLDWALFPKIHIL